MPTKNRAAYKLKIDNPCSEDWTSMTPNGTGRFCSHCSKNVMDLAGLPDSEIIKIIERTGGNFCGRLTRSQTERVLIPAADPSVRRPVPRFLAGLLLAAGAGSASAQGTTDKIENPVTVSPSPHSIIDHPAPPQVPGDSLQRTMRGIVYDSLTGESLYGVVIRVKELNIRAVTDIQGEYSFTLPVFLRADSLTIEVFSIGYKTEIFRINPMELPLRRDVQLVEYSEVILTRGLIVPERVIGAPIVGGVIPERVGFVKRKWWQVKRIFSRK